ncbi:MAG: 1,4-beta-xylanase [Blastocatellia bacterium]|nr:MAG: 1,4-beta-xylanase [Blastocatellia bacterium]
MKSQTTLARHRSWVVLLWLIICCSAPSAQPQKWSAQKANDWYKQQAWLVGSNYVPATAINELEMWQAETFDPQRIDLELTWAQSIGMNTMRVFLHDLLWKDPDGFKGRLNTFLTIAAKHDIRPIFVLFDSVWDPSPQLGKQRAPQPGVHNSGWMQSPGAKALADSSEYPRLEAYVKGVVGAFAHDRRVLAWDIWNEPDNTNGGSYHEAEPKNKVELILALLPKAFAWAREAGAEQPLTSGVWKGDWTEAKLGAMERLQLDQSDVISFHNYDAPTELEKRISWLVRFNRPLICTEYMARGNGSFFIGSLPVFKKYNVAAINWGLVQGKAQTHLPWDSWERPYVNREPAIWFHEVFRTDGAPYIPEEVEYIKRMTGRGKARAAGAK